MERVKIKLPETFQFETELTIRITDVNYGGHVGNDSFLSLIHEARLQFLKNYGYSEMSIEDIGVIMADAAIEFKSELFYGDIVTVKVACTNFAKLGFDIFYLMQKKDTAHTIVAKAKTGMLCMNYETRKLVSVPEAFINTLLR